MHHTYCPHQALRSGAEPTGFRLSCVLPGAVQVAGETTCLIRQCLIKTSRQSIKNEFTVS